MEVVQTGCCFMYKYMYLYIAPEFRNSKLLKRDVGMTVCSTCTLNFELQNFFMEIWKGMDISTVNLQLDFENAFRKSESF